jgi:hypothetical protein
VFMNFMAAAFARDPALNAGSAAAPCTMISGPTRSARVPPARFPDR